MKIIKKLFIGTATLAIILSVLGNLGLHQVIRIFVDPVLEQMPNHTPEKLTLAPSDMKSETLHLMGLKLRFPFDREDIVQVSPSFDSDHNIDNILIKIENEEYTGVFLLMASTDILEENGEALITKDWDRILLGEESVLGILRAVDYARRDDFSWWNLPHNIRLTMLLILKAISMPAYENLKVYDLKTPYLNGILRDGITPKNQKRMVELNFAHKDVMYFVSFYGTDEVDVGAVKEILSTIQPVAEREERYQEMKFLYDHRDQTGYPEELLLLSLISLKGPATDNLKKLLEIMEGKDYPTKVIETVQKEMAFREAD
jgi:hypothetical protein